MATSPPASIEMMQAQLLEALNACPVEQCNAGDCPLYALRQLEFPQRVGWLKSLDHADLEYLLAYHYICMHLKTTAFQGAPLQAPENPPGRDRSA
jgi:hypothetical protein